MPRLLLLFLALLSSTHAQRFLRSSSTMDNDFRGEMKLDSENEAVSGLTREMFLMGDVEWELEPPESLEHVSPALKRHVRKYLRAPVQLKLLKRKGKYGLRAVGVTENGQKLRAFWRQTPPAETRMSGDFAKASYDEAVRSRLFTVEFEVQLPPLKRGDKGLPSVVYQIPLENGSMNPKAMIPRGAGKVKVYPAGHEQGIEAGRGHVGLRMRPGLVDPNWSRGRPAFRPGRSTGLV